MKDVFVFFALLLIIGVGGEEGKNGGGQKEAKSKWIDPDTPIANHYVNVPNRGVNFHINSDGSSTTKKNATDLTTSRYRLIFSDEFNSSKRQFQSGFDEKWTSLDHRDTTNMGQHYFSSQAVQTDDGNLIITTTKPKIRFRGAKYVSGSVQTWNKFCFTSGYIEVRAILPGVWGIPGTWPAIWLMGNLGRASYLKSQDGTWPWSFDYCAPYIEKIQNVHQKISACNNLTVKHDANSLPSHFGLNPHQGRGSTEIDVMEAQVSSRGQPAEISTSLQIRPGIDGSLRPAIGADPGPGQWYELNLGNFTKLNKAYYGDEGLDSVSALTQLNPDAFKAYHIFRLDWRPGVGGYIRWWLDDNFLFEIPEASLNVWKNNVPPRHIPREPSYVILSTAVSEKFSPPCEGQICDSIWPSNFTIDYVRVYQDTTNPSSYQGIGCSPKSFPTTEWIFEHPVDYGLPWYVNLQSSFYLLKILNGLIGGLSIYFVGYKGCHHLSFSSFLTTLPLWCLSFFILFTTHLSMSTNQKNKTHINLEWIHLSISLLCGGVFAGISALLPFASIGLMVGFILSCAIGQLIHILWIRQVFAIAGIIVGVMALTLPTAIRMLNKANNKKNSMNSNNALHHLILICFTGLVGSFYFSVGVADLFLSQNRELTVSIYNYLYSLLIGDGEISSFLSTSSSKCPVWAVYTGWLFVWLLCIFLQLYFGRVLYYLQWQDRTLWLNDHEAFEPMKAETSARTWQPKTNTYGRPSHEQQPIAITPKKMTTVSSNGSYNLFDVTKLSAPMYHFQPIFSVAERVALFFGFQQDNVANQMEHILLLLVNLSRNSNNNNSNNPFEALHDLVFENYKRWCRHLNVKALTHDDEDEVYNSNSQIRQQQSVDAANDSRIVDISLFFFIWGEASNLRHCPEFLTFCFHKMKQEFASYFASKSFNIMNKSSGGIYANSVDMLKKELKKETPGYFLDVVVTPIYNVIKSNMGQSSKDHKDRRNYDDFNEFFWSNSCLKYDYKSVCANNSGKMSVVDAYRMMKGKTFLEKRSWLSSIRAFRRIFEFHLVTFHFLAAFAFAVELETTRYIYHYSFAMILSSVAITPYFLGVLWRAIDIYLTYDENQSRGSNCYSREMIRLICGILINLTITTILTLLYWYAWMFDASSSNWWSIYYTAAVILHEPGFCNACLQVMPNVLTFVRQSPWRPLVVLRNFMNLMNELYVGDNVIDPFRQSISYYAFWISLIAWKMLFSYKFQIRPLIQPTVLLYADHTDSNVEITVTVLLIFIEWLPFVLIYMLDLMIWNSLWVAFSGTFVGFSARIGEIRNFDRIRHSFWEAADNFNKKIIAPLSKAGKQLQKSQSVQWQNVGYGSNEGIVLESVIESPSLARSEQMSTEETALLSFSRCKQTTEELLARKRQKWSFFSEAWNKVIDTMRQGDLLSNQEQIILKFHSFHSSNSSSKTVFLPQFQLAGCFEKLTSVCYEMQQTYFGAHQQEKGNMRQILSPDLEDNGACLQEKLNEKAVQDVFLELLQKEPMLEETVAEMWELSMWLLSNILGPCHIDDLNFLHSTISSWMSAGAFRTLDLSCLQTSGKHLAIIVDLLRKHMGQWKSNIKQPPQRTKHASDFAHMKFPSTNNPSPAFTNSSSPVPLSATNQSSLIGGGGGGLGGLHKSASTTGLSSLGGKVPRRSRGSGITRIAAMQSTGHTPNMNSPLSTSKISGIARTHSGGKTLGTLPLPPCNNSPLPQQSQALPSRITTAESNASSSSPAPLPSGCIPSSHISQLRDHLRAFFNVFKSSLNLLKQKNNSMGALYHQSKEVSDRLTWLLTQERGFMWEDAYSEEQLALFCFDSNSNWILNQIYGILTLQTVDAEPKSLDAKRRLLFFTNSLFMEMPVAPLLEEMLSYSVVTPFYGEDVLYSQSILESTKDGLDVHTLLYLQTLYKRDWNNFIERIRPKMKKSTKTNISLKSIWRRPELALELRLWASLRGQTLARTVQGMMFGEEAIRILSRLEQSSAHDINSLIKTKFNYVVACQIYGRQKKNNDPKARDIEYLLKRFDNLRVAYIDEVRVNYQKDHSYFAVLIKASSSSSKREIEEVYRIRLPGSPMLGEGKPENQNAAIIFTRGEHLQTIDMNQDGYLEENFKMRNLLQEFQKKSNNRPTTIVGLPEHIFTGSVSSLANYMALQETSFVTLGQRTLANPLRIRLHYGHPDVFCKLFFMTRGGISKASKGINLSEDIFAGYNNCIRGGSVAFPEYVVVGKGRDVGMQQIYKFEAKLAQGAAEQSLSRDVFRLAERLDFFKCCSFYFNHVGFYLSMSGVIYTVFLLTYLNLVKSILGLEAIGGRLPKLMSTLQIMLGFVAFFTTAPLLATITVQRGFKAAAREVLLVIVTGGPLYFLFHIGTKWFYFGQTLLAGGAKYRATGRGFVTKHAHFDELYRFYASSHLIAGFEIGAALLIYKAYTVSSSQYFAMTWSLWLVVVSWIISPFWFNPLAFEWTDVVEDVQKWLRWMRGDGGNPDQSWEAWFKEENGYFGSLANWAKTCIILKGIVYGVVGVSLITSGDSYHSLAALSSWLPVSIVVGVFLLGAFFWLFLFRSIESGLIRFLKFVYYLTLVVGIGICLLYVDRMGTCLIALYYFGAMLGAFGLVAFGSNSPLVSQIYYIHDTLLGICLLGFLLFFSALFVPGKIQTWLLYNNALSRGVVIDNILRTQSDQDNEDGNSSGVLKGDDVRNMRRLILEQQHIINVLATNSNSTSSLGKTGSTNDALSVLLQSSGSSSSLLCLQDQHTMGSTDNLQEENDINNSNLRVNVSDSDLSHEKKQSFDMRSYLEQDEEHRIGSIEAYNGTRPRRSNSSNDASLCAPSSHTSRNDT